MFNSETKICQNCKNQFIIEPEDFVFYEKIKVPSPTFCPECRLQRRFAVLNERILYKRKCDLCKNEIFSLYHPDVLFPVYCQKCWYSDNWNPMDYGKDYDFNKPFFEQYRELMNVVPRFALVNFNSVNCDYCTKVWNSKNCYLTIGFETENCLYGNYTRCAKNCVDYFMLVKCDSCYESINCTSCSKVYFSQCAIECRDSYFLYDCRNCSDCFGCVNLRNKQYYIFNKPYSKEEYEKIMRDKYDFSGFKNLNLAREKFNEFVNRIPRRYAALLKTIDTTGNNIIGAKNCRNCFDSDTLNYNTENARYIFMATGISDSYDMSETGEGAQLCYDSVISFGYNILFTVNAAGESYNVAYSDLSRPANHIFGCIGLRNKQYCILNKQYTKEEYEEMVSKIIRHMNEAPYADKKGRIYKYGEFFPIELSPFAYNETIANEYFPLDKKEIDNCGYRYTDIRKYKGSYDLTIQAKDIPDNIKDIKDNILNEIIGCFNSSACKGIGVFKIIKPELEFYRKMNLPLPRLCPNCRHYQRIKQRNPLKLWHRQCQCAGEKSDNKVYQNTIKHFHEENHCPNEFETTYAPDRKEIVYCEKCYQQEVV